MSNHITIEESVVKAMDGTRVEIYRYIPYILQDFWEMGSDPETIINLVKSNLAIKTSTRVLDLGCGKGAVTISIARELGYECLGIDAVAEFIDVARLKAEAIGVANLCDFETNDIRTRVKSLNKFSAIILGSIGPVFGNMFNTLKSISHLLETNGIIVIDDGYIPDNSTFEHPALVKRSEYINQVERSGMAIVNEVIHDYGDQRGGLNSEEFSRVENRCRELARLHPAEKHLFDEYIENQRREYYYLENHVICSTMVIKPIY